MWSIKSALGLVCFIITNSTRHSPCQKAVNMTNIFVKTRIYETNAAGRYPWQIYASIRRENIIRVWISNYISCFMYDVITHPYTKFSESLEFIWHEFTAIFLCCRISMVVIPVYVAMKLYTFHMSCECNSCSSWYVSPRMEWMFVHFTWTS